MLSTSFPQYSHYIITELMFREASPHQSRLEQNQLPQRRLRNSCKENKLQKNPDHTVDRVFRREPAPKHSRELKLCTVPIVTEFVFLKQESTVNNQDDKNIK
jgi:hypothetical protein